MLFGFGIISAILIITACINFINLSTAEAIKRSKEIGIRKTMGSSRGQLILQFLGETTLITVIAVVLSLGITQLALGFVNPFLNLHLALDFTNGTDLVLFLTGVTVIVSLLSGLYPAWVISGYKPAQALKNQINNRNSSGFWLRKGLVVVQFVFSQFFIIGTIVIIKQTNYFHQKDLGFNKDAILILPIPDEQGVDPTLTTSRKKTLRNELSEIPGVEHVSLGSSPPSSGSVSKTTFQLKGEDREFVVQIKRVDDKYLDVYGLKLLAGNNVQDTDTLNGFVVNEELARSSGFTNPHDIIGREIMYADRTFPIVGVVKDFHTVKLHNAIEPTALFNRADEYRTVAVKINMSKLESTMGHIKAKWESTYPEHLFEYEFLDESIRKFYENERKMALLLGVFTSFSIFIGCLGLFGLATFMANQKTKEIGVRKVLGASVESIVLMFSREYVILIAIGFLIAAPMAGFAMLQFLNEFSYKIPLGAGIFITGLGVTLFIALITVGYKSVSAAIVNPVKSLRYE
jgi:ABC-type antimicrobial peptide transport system permease subunit